MKECFTLAGKVITLYKAKQTDQPLVVLNMFEDDSSGVVAELQKLSNFDINLLVISKLNWNSDLSPWEIAPISKQEPPFTGDASVYLDWLLNEVLPKGLGLIAGTPTKTYIAGYSMAGLFALYALYNCDIFDRAACMSSSFWFPDFKKYVESHQMKREPDKLYFSLGDKEAKTKHQILKTVQENTEAIVNHLREQNIDVTFEMNEGNHFKDIEWRIAKGIAEICR
ncbi:alpha/beta hydrolase [Veillonella ratti]|uniref:alpha/beta hydrolase n=1 Tax=Veillonella ratti TaxID=103892 RepID=UPI000F8F14CF|nr:alpha/beta hydrolase-fold protein [Veillonella ratti]